MGFWLVTGTMTILVLALFLIALLRRWKAEPLEDPDVQVYRDQLKSLDNDVARGLLIDSEAKPARVEIARRLLEADRAHQQTAPDTSAPHGLSLAFAGLISLILLGGSFFLYQRLGASGYPDMPYKARLAAAESLRAERPSQAQAESGAPSQIPNADPQHVALVAKLRAAVAERPEDLRGLALLASNEAAIGNYVAAHQAQAKVIELRGAAASADDYTQYADFLIVASGGYVSPTAEQALTEALRRDPAQPSARYYSGLMFAQIGRPDLAFRLWRTLLEESPPEAPWSRAIRGQIQDLAALAGENYTPPANLPGPDAEAVAAAQDMSEADRNAMIRTMVTGLAERLATQGGSAQEWARLIGAYGVLGEVEKASTVWAEAQTVFAGRADDLATVKAAAEGAGVAQ